MSTDYKASGPSDRQSPDDPAYGSKYFKECVQLLQPFFKLPGVSISAIYVNQWVHTRVQSRSIRKLKYTNNLQGANKTRESAVLWITNETGGCLEI